MIIDARVRIPPAYCDNPEPRPRELSERYGNVLDLAGIEQLGLEQLDTIASDNGIDMMLVHAEYEHGDPADTFNGALAELVTHNPARYRGVGTLSQAYPLDIMRALSQLQFCADQGFVGVSLQPGFFHYAINDKRLYPVYARATELGLAVFLHTGINYGSTHAIGNEHPLMLDEIACAFPGLRLVACHAAWPWTTEMAAVARKHPQVYLEFGGLAPRYVAKAGTGWDVLFHFMNSLLQDQVLFGSDWPAFDPGTALSQWREAGLKDSVLSKLLGGNAARLFGLD